MNYLPENNDEFDEHLLELTFTSGSPLSQGIPWTKYTELEIQGILKIHFEIQGYKVIWRHKDDPANEGGVDLECQKDGKTSIIIAVKRKPNKNALGQLFELSTKDVKKKIYVYVGGATQSFRDNMKKIQGVDFWDVSTLENKLAETDLTLQLLTDNSRTNQAMLSIMRKIKGLMKDEKYITNKSIPQNTTDTLWAMKDRAVTAHRCITMAQLLFERTDLFGELTNNQIHDIAIWCMDYIYIYGLLSLQLEFNQMHIEMKKLFKIAYVNTRTRSNWFSLLTYAPGLMPGYVISEISKYEKEKEKAKPFNEKINKMMETENIPEITRTKQDILADQFRRLNVWTYGLEGAIDYLYQYRNELNQER